MEMNSTSSLDGLASNGVINFDADAYVKGTTPRYVGNPFGSQYLPFDQPIITSPNYYGIAPGANLSGHPSTDAFVSKGEGKEGHQLPWNKIIAGGIIGSLALFIASKAKNIFVKDTNKATKIGEVFNNCKDKVVNFFKDGETTKKVKEAADAVKDTTKETAKEVTETVKDTIKEVTKDTTEKAAESTKKGLFSSIKDKISKLPKKAKIAGGIGIGLVVLYEAYKHITGAQNQEVHE